MSVVAETGGRHALHTLRVSEVEHLTEDAVAITFEVPSELLTTFDFQPGQHVAIVRSAGGDELRRSYSISSPVGGPLRVAVKLLPEGRFSNYACNQLKPGHTLEVLPPVGRFTTALDPTRARRYAAIVAGSGITPVLSILSSALSIEHDSRFTLIYGNRTTASIMFLEELEDLKDRYPERFQLVHVLSREAPGVDLLAGRIDQEKLTRILERLLPAASVDEWFLCGPLKMIEGVRATLIDAGVPAAAIHRELFHAQDVAPPTAPDYVAAEPGTGAAVEVILDGRRNALTVPHDGLSILEATLRVRPDAPFACKGGVCGTCRCRLLEGQVRMDHSYALEDDELADGLVLACQSHPATDRVVLDFDRL
ncbi:MAG: phenylacetate-CoA oxygenase/reductase subunit PaaK [Actinomycetota bacterium]|nr:phenylacetate-CoA oxygenase/reductase subunit PaaK [Actinomycetota bacterium]